MILALFENGASSELRVALYKAPGDRARLLDAYVTTECEGAVTRSARRAAEGVLNWLPVKERPSEPMVAGFDLAGIATDQPLAGESAGLAFAVALAAQMTGRDPGNIAVTGILAEGSAGTAILPVKGLAAKLAAALERTEITTVFYPEANQKEIDTALRSKACGRTVRLVPVKRLDEVLDALFSRVEPCLPLPPPHRSVWPLGLLIAILIGTALITFIYWQTIRAGQELVTPLPTINMPKASEVAPPAIDSPPSVTVQPVAATVSAVPASTPPRLSPPVKPMPLTPIAPIKGTAPQPSNLKSPDKAGQGFD